ncbi:dynein regulatory complex protein 10 [Platichthys flesus]|uniref:dynein regulatory complex protein 10 n=1 Tax=Platichthys flesus TaxID=8260 RepID=UPI002DBCBE27|nr:dynein regulatory complex protein 10 [Platichthys flesus]
MSSKEATVAETKTKLKDRLMNPDLSEAIPLSVEAQPISRVLEHRISQIEVVVTLPAILRFNSASSVVDEKLNRALEKHRLLAERLERETQDGLKKEAEGEDGEEQKRANTRLERDIKDSVKDLLRLLWTHPDAIPVFRAERGVEAEESEVKLIRGLKMFHSQMVDRLLTSVHEEQQLVLYKPSSSSPAHSQVHKAPVEEEVAAAIKAIDAKISQKNVEIEKLQESLDANNSQKLHISPTYKKCQPHISEKQASMQQEVDPLNNQLNNLLRENKQAERALQEKNEKVEAEIEYLLQRFDSDMAEKQAELELNEIECEREEEELRKQKEPFSVLETEYDQIIERRRLAEEKRQEEMKELELKTKAAIFAQAWWRGYSTRKALKNKGKNKGKKGKGKELGILPFIMSAKTGTVLATTNAKTQSKDRLKNPDLSEATSLSVEAQPISRVLENRISQIETVVTLPAILRFNSASSVVDEKLNRALEKHRLLAERLERETQDDLEKGAEDEDGEERKRANTRLERDIKDSVKDLLRLLRSHPDAIPVFRAERGVEAGESEVKLITGLKMFHIQMVDRLLTSVHEEQQLVLYKPSSSSPAHSQVHKAPVEEEVAAAIKAIDAKISQKNEEIKDVQQSLDNIIATAQKVFISPTYGTFQPEISEKQASMQQDVNKQSSQRDSLLRENKQAERALQEKNDILETEIEYLLRQFDSDMAEKQADLELNEIDCERMEEEQRKLKEPYSILEIEYDKIIEKRRLAEEKRQEEMKELELKTKAAIIAQAWWRGYSIRRDLKNKGKKKKGNKDKGIKGKGKGKGKKK